MANYLMSTFNKSVTILGASDATQAGAPWTNLFTNQPSKVGLASGLASVIGFDLGSTKTVRMIYVGYTNFRRGETQIQIKADASSANVFGTASYDSGLADAIPNNSWYDSWGRQHYYWFDDTGKAFRYWSIGVVQNAPFASIGIVMFMTTDTIVQPTRNIDIGWTIDMVDEATQRRTIQGNVYPNANNPRYRRLNASVSYQDEASMFNDHFKLMRIVGSREPVFFIVDPANTNLRRLRDHSIYGVVSGSNQIQHQVLDLYRHQFQLDEWEYP